jgi:DNA protecting protein DprA
VPTERDKLIRLFSKYEPTAWLIRKVLEFGVSGAIAQAKKSKQLIAYPSTSAQQTCDLPIRIITYLDACWPKQLFDLDTEMPLVLWVSGDAPAGTAVKSAIAIAGPNQPSLSTVRTAGRIIYCATGAATAVFSDGSFGVSSLVHRIAISINQLNFAVLPAGINQPYPRRNHTLLTDIAKTGALISEYPPNIAVNRGRLLRRNRIIAAMSDLAVVIAAPPRSGAANIAYWAEQLGRELVEVN